MSGKIYGYARVSTKEQNEDRQIIALREKGIDEENIYLDKISGKDFNRPMYKRLMKKLRLDDLVYMVSIDRLGRSYDEIKEQWRILTKEKGVDLVILDMPLLDTRTYKDLMGTFVSDVVLEVLSFAAEHERANIRKRQREGIDAARQRGARFGRPSKPLPPEFYEAYSKWYSRKLSGKSAAELCGMSQSTFYRKAIGVRKNQPS